MRWPALAGCHDPIEPQPQPQLQNERLDWRQGRVTRTGEFSNETLAELGLTELGLLDLPDVQVLQEARNPLPEELARLRGGLFRVDGLGRVLSVGGDDCQTLIGRSFFAELAPWAGDLAARFHDMAARPERTAILSVERATPGGQVILIVSPARGVGQHLISLVRRPDGPVPAAEMLAEVS